MATKKLTKAQSDLINRNLVKWAIRGKSEWHCDWYVRWVNPALDFLHVRKPKGRKPKHEFVIMTGGGCRHERTSINAIEVEFNYYNGLWCAN